MLEQGIKMLKGELLNLQTHRKVAKIGMTATLTSVVLTSFFVKKNKTARNIHIASGWAFVAFSLYHAGLYDNVFFKNMIMKAQKQNTINNRLKKDGNETN